ncbi:MAG TPA: FliM/FliN family flagellar motor switch protein [Arthrobacter sp.]
MSTTLSTSAVSALTDSLPTPLPYGSNIITDRSALAGKVSGAVSATFVGSVSADVALVLLDDAAMMEAAGAESSLVSASDVLRPALEAATRVLGAGVLGEARVEDATALFNDKDTVVFELISGGTAAGWFAIRVREQGSVRGTSPAASPASNAKLGRINNVEMGLTVAIGHTRLSVRSVLDLEPGRVIELDRSAGAPADVLLNGRLIAHGEVVVVDSDYAVKITKILDVTEALV